MIGVFCAKPLSSMFILTLNNKQSAEGTDQSEEGSRSVPPAFCFYLGSTLQSLVPLFDPTSSGVRGVKAHVSATSTGPCNVPV